MPLWSQILIGMVLGALVGVFWGADAAMLKPLGTLFIKLIKMIIVPLVFFSLVSAFTDVEDGKAVGRLGVKSFVLYLLTTAFAITMGLLVAHIVQPGKGVHVDYGQEINGRVPTEAAEMSVIDTIINVVPTNPIQAFAEGNMLQIIVFSLFMGVAVHRARTMEKLGGLPGMITGAAEVMYQMTHMVMYVAPIGVFGLMAWMVGTQDATVLLSLFKVVICIFGVCLLQIIVVYGGLLRFVAGINPFHFFRQLLPAQLMAFSTSSSAATLPLTMEIAKEKLGISNRTASFTLPLGTTINMDGTALYQGVTALFIAQTMGIEFGMADYVTIILTATLASIGSAGVPGAGLIMLTLVLTSVGLPIEGVALIVGVDRLLDMVRTVVNVSGDATVALLVDKSEKTFDDRLYKAD